MRKSMLFLLILGLCILYLESDPPFAISEMQKINVRPGMTERPPDRFKFPKLEVTGVDLVPYPDGTVNVVFGYKNAGTAPLPRRSEFAVQPDYRVVVDGRDLDKGDLFIPEIPAQPGWEVKTHSGGSLKFPSLKWDYQWHIGDMITVYINERRAGGMEADSRIFNLKGMALKFGYDLLMNGMEFDWATNTLKIFIRLDGKIDPGKSFTLIVRGSNILEFHTEIRASQPAFVFTHKFDIWARTNRISFDGYALFGLDGGEPILDVDQRNNNFSRSFDRPR